MQILNRQEKKKEKKKKSINLIWTFRELVGITYERYISISAQQPSSETDDKRPLSCCFSNASSFVPLAYFRQEASCHHDCQA